MADSFTSNMYRLRCASPMPIYGSGSFVLHTFGVEVLIQTSYLCTTDIPSSSDFRGQGGSQKLMSASFSRLNTSVEMYQGKIVRDPGEGSNWIESMP